MKVLSGEKYCGFEWLSIVTSYWREWLRIIAFLEDARSNLRHVPIDEATPPLSRQYFAPGLFPACCTRASWVVEESKPLSRLSPW